MRRVIKDSNSSIISDNLKYIPNNKTNNDNLASVILQEQKKFCAYTDEFITRTDAKDIEHFNPTLKNTHLDNYNNWFIVKHQWNKEKSYKWDKFQPILYPTADDFEDRIVYLNGDYIANSNLDIEAKNLISLLKLDDSALANKRKRYIRRKKEEIIAFALPNDIFFSILIAADINQVSYLRAIKEEFGIDLWPMLP